jgi:hypothetical protein
MNNILFHPFLPARSMYLKITTAVRIPISNIEATENQFPCFIKL